MITCKIPTKSVTWLRPAPPHCSLHNFFSSSARQWEKQWQTNPLVGSTPPHFSSHHPTAPLTTLSPGKDKTGFGPLCTSPFFSTQSHTLFFSEVRIPYFPAMMGVWNNLDTNTLLQAPPLMSLAETRTVGHYHYHCALMQFLQVTAFWRAEAVAL